MYSYMCSPSLDSDSGPGSANLISFYVTLELLFSISLWLHEDMHVASLFDVTSVVIS